MIQRYKPDWKCFTLEEAGDGEYVLYDDVKHFVEGGCLGCNGCITKVEKCSECSRYWPDNYRS